MTRDEVRNKMHDYFDGLLSADERSTIESYLEEYDDVANEYELLSKLLKKSEQLPIGIKPPKEILDNISDELLSKSLEKVESQKQNRLQKITEQSDGKSKLKFTVREVESPATETPVIKSDRSKLKLPIVLFVILIIIVGGYFLFGYLSDNLPWNLSVNYGEYQINGVYSGKNTLAKDDVISTLDSSSVVLRIPKTGTVDLGSFTFVKVLKGQESENIIALQNGSIYADCKIDNPNLIVKTNPVNIIAISGIFIVEIDVTGKVRVETTNGLVRLTNQNEKLLLIQDHICNVRKAGEFGIPYHKDANSEFVAMLKEISFGTQPVINYGPILELTTPLDGISLLHMIKEAKNNADKLSIFLKLSEYYPPPPGITQDGIINNNKEMFSDWHDEIEWQI